MADTKMINLEVDGQPVAVPEGSMVMAATRALGVYVPHFCWHRKLSIAANCRMCLVQVEKAPKPLPACATPATEGMKVWTRSDQAVKAQKGVMEFLLINHPLDCPICDQGGECQLQDLAVGYGGSASRYREVKRVVPSKDIGPLVAAEEMSRCIHCTRCVRFGQEIAGVMELGMAGRGEHSEILAFVGRSVDSELSGNMVDLCPVGALTSRPFRYSARTWELARRRSVSPHCGLGANLVVQVRGNRVMRVLPADNEAVNECWLSDKDRYSYEALNGTDRLTRPLVRRDGAWVETDWQGALEAVVQGLGAIRTEGSAARIGILASPHSTLEELHLAARLAAGLGTPHVDFRLRRTDAALDGGRRGAPWLGMPVAALNHLKCVLVVGSNLRKDHPLLAQRLRQAAKAGARVSLLTSFADDPLIAGAVVDTARPSALPRRLAAVLAAVLRVKGLMPEPAVATLLRGVVPGANDEALARRLCDGAGESAVFLGNAAQHHPSAALLDGLGQALARALGARYGFLGEAANSVGGYLAGAVPAPVGLDAAAMMAQPREAYVLLHAEPELDMADGHAALAALRAARFVVALSPFAHRATEYAHVILPVAPFTETAGTFVNTEGRAQSFKGVVAPLGETRPAWKVLRVLGNLLGLEGFQFDSAEQVRDAVLGAGVTDLSARLDNTLAAVPDGPLPDAVGGLERVGDVPIHFADPLVRRAPALQHTADGAVPTAAMHASTLADLGLDPGAAVKVRQGDAAAVLYAARDDRLAPGCVRLPAGHPLTATLGPLGGSLELARAVEPARASA
jgi:NADH-quinone oxidoreductase subunit G